MAKQAISVTLDSNNILWLRGQALIKGRRSLSEMLDRLITEARTKGRDATIRSVVGTVTINPDDPYLEKANEYVRSLFEESVKNTARQIGIDVTGPLEVRERPATYARSPRPRKGKGRG